MKSAVKASLIRCRSLGLAILGLSLAAARADEQKPVTSALGYVAVEVPSDPPEEGSCDTVITKDQKPVLRVPNARPLSFSPDGGILLLGEAAADDDCRQFLLHVAAGEKPKPFGKRTTIGGRHVAKAEWSADGKTITFTDSEAAGKKQQVITVADHLEKAPKKGK